MPPLPAGHRRAYPYGRLMTSMCGRFGLTPQSEDLEQRFSATLTFDYEPRYNIAPEGSGIAAIQNESPDKINKLQWGLLPRWVDDSEEFPDLINARAETVAEKNSFKDAFRKHRCLIPASNFYEWTCQQGQRIPYAIGFEGEAIFAMAGLWETWFANGTVITSATILTTDANDVVGEIHDRMPVILEHEEEQHWLDADDSAELQAMLKPFPSERTTSYRVSTPVNNPANDGPRLVEPVGTDQTGLEEFG